MCFGIRGLEKNNPRRLLTQTMAGIILKEEQNMKEQLTVERQLRLGTINY